ncbi:ExeM/NucH family extracellular endonuclease [Corynebacterium sp. Q4381]|uniref:ExeM/NucH family extracellular endonuclease n=1 Tax=Corynebacterium sp. Marseille-Q4381 TaxID=3121597 RepID=UPI002FE63040
MRNSNRKALSATFAIALAAGTVSVVAPSASAAVDGTNVVINEVYGGGGNSGSVYSNDFVELYNPTDAPIDITGWQIEQYSANGGKGGRHPHVLNGTIQPKSFFLVQGWAGNNATGELPAPDQILNFDFAGKQAIAKLIDANGSVVDLLGWGAAKEAEGDSPAAGTNNGTSVQRKRDGVDTDNNANDFKVDAPTPGASNGEETPEPNNPDPTDPQPQPQPQPTEPVTIADIQGPGASSPLEGQTVTTRGVVTAVYNEGGRDGFYMQTPGAGKVKNDGDASDAVFVYMGKGAKPETYPARGSYIEVTGKVEEFNTSTQLSGPRITALNEDFEPVTPVEFDSLPAGDEARERYEGMLVKPGVHTVTDNYSFNTYGEMGIVPGEEPLRQPTDVMAPGEEAYALEQEQLKSIILLDDASTYNYFRNNKDIPLPYLQTSDKGIKSMRVGDQLEFKDSGVIVEYSFNAWRFQPLVPLTGKSPEEDLPVEWADTREAVRNVPSQVKGDLSIGSFNVLNYFTTLGETEAGCKAYQDRFGNDIAANRCNVRGAFTQDAFKDQQDKIVLAINELDASVVGLMEVENTAKTSGDVAKRDESLGKLVEALNDAGGTWDYVKSPAQLGTNEDFIRVAFIYNKDKVEPVGESVIFDDPAFTGTARQPLAQEFKPKGGSDDESFVAIVNHFKSKGSVARGDADQNDGQANNPNVRKAQAQALLDHLQQQNQWDNKPVFILGDLNSYSREDSITALNGGGFEIVEHNAEHNVAGAGAAAQESSYSFGKHVGSLDHVLANEAARALVQDAAVWNINADEPIVFQYSRRNYHGADLFQNDNPFAASDHDPVKVGISFPEREKDQHEPESGDAITVTQNEELPEAKSVIKNADALPEGTTFQWSDAKTDQPGAGQKRAVLVTYPDGSQDSVEVTVNVNKPRFVADAVINNDGDLIITYSDGETSNLGKVAAQPGTDGRGVTSAEVNDNGELVLTYSDGTTQNLGKVTGSTPAPAPAPGTNASSNGRCIAAAVGWGLPLVALVPLGLAATIGIPALQPVQDQVNQLNTLAQQQLNVFVPQLALTAEQLSSMGIGAVQALTGLAAISLGAAAIATLVSACGDAGSSN